MPAEVTDQKLECLENNGWLIEEIIEKLLRHFCSTIEGQKSVLFFVQLREAKLHRSTSRFCLCK